MSNKVTQKVILLGAMALSIVACGSQGAVERSYGDSVKSNVRAQVYDPATLISPSSDPVEGTDGQRMEGAMEKLRGQQSDASDVAKPIVINVGD